MFFAGKRRWLFSVSAIAAISSSANASILSISGYPANGVKSHISVSAPGSLTLTGSAAAGYRGYLSSANPGEFVITGYQAIRGESAASGLLKIWDGAGWLTVGGGSGSATVAQVTKAAIEAVLTGVISSHTHQSAHTDPDTGTRYIMGVTIDPDTGGPVTTWTELA